MTPVTGLDTTPDAQRIHAAVLRQMTPEERIHAAFAMSEDARQITCAGIRSRNPEWDEARVRYEMLVRLYGAALVARAWGPPAQA